MKRWRRRLMRWGKWACTLAAVLIAGAWTVSLWWFAQWIRGGGTEPKTVMIYGGVLRAEGIHWPKGKQVPRPRTEYSFDPTSTPYRWRLYWWPPVWDTWTLPDVDGRVWRGVLPLWIPFVAVAIPSGLLWCREL